ncbi:ATP-binding protein [Rhizobium sp. CG5]|uniref:ATP-binding protein n=1 Tax=Rhizobium sp. CG5 TaxID=2726076 RepID=UPI0020346BAD|nr:ATP-binding protein [Rhizobium sp. CG5]MCM2477555.1 ATP-binding protein [Rhizobium sp. CG5]
MTDEPLETPETIAVTLRKRAAVVGTFDPLRLLAKAVPGARDEAFEDRVFSELSASVEEVADTTQVLWRLQPEVRREALRELALLDELDRTIAQTAPERGDRFGHILQATLRKGAAGNGADIQKMSKDDLMLQALALDFARSLPARRNSTTREPAIDPRILLARQAERRRQDYVAPTKLFGRDDATKALDRYIAEGAIMSPFIRMAPPAGEPVRLRPLLLTGIGGSGKSALVADLMRRTQRSDWSGPIVACLDFDQRNVALGGEREWLNELTRQIGFARPGLDAALSKIRSNARQELHNRTLKTTDVDRLTGTDSLLVVSGMREELQKALGDGALASQTLVVIVDTFEEVLVRSDIRAASLSQEPFGLVLSFIDSLTRLVSADSEPVFGAVRAIIAGRADPFPTDKSTSARWFEASWEVGELDIDAASEFLRGRADRHVFTKARAQRIVQVLPRFPLILILLAAFARGRNAQEIDEVIGAAQGTGILGAAASTRVLYSRFLDRLKDHIINDATGERLVPRGDLVRLAHPGLALSVVTPELIRHVLAVPTGLGAIDEQRARDLFSALSREVWLVERVGDDAVRHIPVLRRIMLPMLNGDLTPAENANTEMRETVRAVHRVAAQWYRSGGVNELNAAVLAAYHDAFLGEVTALAADPSLVRRVLDVAGEDVSAMPTTARAVLRREARSDEGLSVEETAALPVRQRREVDATRQSRRTKSGITSRHFDVGDEEESVRTGIEADSSIFVSPPIPSEPSVATVGRFLGDQIDVLQDKETAQRIESMFAEADFNGVVSYGTYAAAQLCERAQEEPPLDKLGDTTSHWTWKWALSCLTAGAGDESLLKWAVVDSQHINALSNNTPFRLGTLLSLAIATVALGRAPSFKDEPPYRDAIKTYPVIESAPVTSILSLRLRVLANYWDKDRLLAPQHAFEVRPDVVRLLALWSPTPSTEASVPGVPPSIVQLPEELQRRLADFQHSPPLSSDLRILDDGGDSIFFPISNPYSWWSASELPPITRRTLGSLLRGRSPELYDPVRAALGDAAAADETIFAAAVAEITQFAPFWPTDCVSDLFRNTRNNLREVDYLLARFVVFIDLAGLTSPLFSALARQGKFSRRFHAVAKLVQAYDSLLLAPYDAVDLVPASRSMDDLLSDNLIIRNSKMGDTS